jgi:hypothetical protein
MSLENTSAWTAKTIRLRTSAHWRWKGIQELESRLAGLGRVGLAYPDYAGFNEEVGIGGKKQAHGLARGKGGVGLQSQAIGGEVNGSPDVFSLLTFDHHSHSHLNPLTLRRAPN